MCFPSLAVQLQPKVSDISMFLSLFTSRIRHRFLRVCEKLFAEDIFRIYDDFSPLRGKKTAISKHDNADHGELSTNQSLVIVYSLLGAKIPFMGANKFVWSATMKPEMGLETQTKMNLLSQEIFAKNKSWITGKPHAMFVFFWDPCVLLSIIFDAKIVNQT